jgi:hypothetical protein
MSSLSYAPTAIAWFSSNSVNALMSLEVVFIYVSIFFSVLHKKNTKTGRKGGNGDRAPVLHSA